MDTEVRDIGLGAQESLTLQIYSRTGIEYRAQGVGAQQTIEHITSITVRNIVEHRAKEKESHINNKEHYTPQN